MAVSGVIFLILLGIWQLHRAKEKEAILNQQAAFAMRAPRLWQPNLKNIQTFQKIKIDGSYLPVVFLLDNQFYQHHLGYHVLSPLQLQDGQVVIIDRGWIPAGISRTVLPPITNPKKPLTLQGDVYIPSNKQWALGIGLEEKTPNLAVIEQLDISLMSQFLHKSIYPFIIRLNKNEAYGFIRKWEVVSMQPSRHIGYAVQWFAMAAVLFLTYISLLIKHK